MKPSSEASFEAIYAYGVTIEHGVCEQVSYYLQGLCSDALLSFIAEDVTSAFAGLPLNCSTMTGANDRAAGEQQAVSQIAPAQTFFLIYMRALVNSTSCCSLQFMTKCLQE